MTPKVGCIYRMMKTKLPWLLEVDSFLPLTPGSVILPYEINVKKGHEPVCLVLEIGKWQGMLAVVVFMSDGRFGQLRYLNEDEDDFEELE